MNFWKYNFTILLEQNPQLAQAMQEVSVSGCYKVQPSKSGLPTLIQVLDGGKQVNLHSSYNPEREASHFIDSCKTDISINFIAGGFGLGYHLLELVKRVSPQARIVVIEKNLEILRLAFENIDLRALLQHPGFSLQVGIDDHAMVALVNNDLTFYALYGYVSITFRPLVEADLEYYETMDCVFQKELQHARINLKTQSVLSKRYYWNILENLPNLVSCPGILSMENMMQGVPAILVSAGPSLDKNLPLLKKASKGALIIAVATAFPPLLSGGICPDFVVAIDPDETSIRSFDLQAPNGNSSLLFEPSLPPPIVEFFSGLRVTLDSNLFLSQWISRFLGGKGRLGKSQSVAHTGYLFARFLGCDPIILTGQDLAFFGITLHCRESYFENLFLHAIQADKTSGDNRREHFQKYRNALITAKDIFGGCIQTTLAMDSFKNLFAEEIQKKSTVYNATEGGLLIPGVRSLSLKEVIHRFCRKPRRKFIPKLEFETKNQTVSYLIDALNVKRDTLIKLKNHLIQIKDHLDNKRLNEEEFIRKMERVYESLIQDEDTIRLLQDYAYSEFLQWNQENHVITMTLKENDPIKTLHAKLERDRKFLQALVEAAEFLEMAFSGSVKKLLLR